MRNPIWKAAALTVFIIIFLAVPLYWGRALKEADAPKVLRVLFIGNSLTYSNDLPAVVEAFTKSTDQRPFTYKTIAFPNFSLEDHWNKKDARKAIMKGGWDFVVMQQGPSASKEGRALLIEYSRRFAEDIRKTGARPALYSVWPSASRMQDFTGVGESYRQAAADVDGLLFPVGEAWLTAWRSDPSLGLYSADGLHPSSAGTYLAGLVIYGQLYNRSPVGLPFKLVLGSGATIEIPADQAILMQHSAEEANNEEAVRQIERMYRDAVMQQDVAALSRILADDFIATSSRGEIRNKAKEIDDIRPTPDFKMEAFNLDDINVRIFADAAIVTGRSTLKVAFKGQSNTSAFRYTRVYLKRNGRWQTVAQQLTRMPQQ